MERIALFPGSFDPMTTGHLALLQRAMPLFDKIIVAVGINKDKRNAYPLDERMQRIRMAVNNMPNVEVATYESLTTDFCHECGARFILRGVRSLSDYEYERNIADINRTIAPDIETVFLFADPAHAMISSSMIRELRAFGKDVSDFLA